MAKILSNQFDNIIISKPGNFKKSYPEQVYNSFKKFNENTILITDPASALEYSLKISKNKIPILVTGSFYMISEIQKLVINKGDFNVFKKDE